MRQNDVSSFLRTNFAILNLGVQPERFIVSYRKAPLVDSENITKIETSWKRR